MNDTTNPDEVEFQSPVTSHYADVYELENLGNGMVRLSFGIYDGNEYISNPVAVVMTRENAAAIGGSLLKLTGN